MKRPSGRNLAAGVLFRVFADGAFAAAALEAEIERSPQLDARERAFATELVYGTLRVEPWLSAQIDAFATKGTKKLDPSVRVHLLIAAYQLYFLRVPAFAAVNEAVTEIRGVRGGNLAPFANAVLRKVAAAAASAGDVKEKAILGSAPKWLVKGLTRSIGAESARSFVLASSEPPPTGIRVVNATARDEWAARFREGAMGVEVALGKASPHALLLRGAGPLNLLPGWGEGEWTVQEEGSQVVALAAAASAGEVVLDACAGRGNKTAVLAASVGPSGAVDAADLYPTKLERLSQELAKQGLAARHTFAVDWSVGAGDVPSGYDCVLLDAPCSGTGTLRRRPDILLRRTAADVGALSALQSQLLARVSDLVKPGGRIVYAVCSVLAVEAEEVIERALVANPSLERAPFASPVVAELAQGGTTLRLLPQVHGTDGYFIASLRRRAM